MCEENKLHVDKHYINHNFQHTLFTNSHSYSQKQRLKEHELTIVLKQLEYLNLSLDVSKIEEKAMTCSSIENYLRLNQLWRREKMATMKDYLCYYNNLDMEPFVEAISNMSKFYIENDIDLFKDAIGTPGIARKLIFRSRDANFQLVDQQNEDLFLKLKKNLVGGPSIVMHREIIVYKDYLRDGAKLCKGVVGYDSNALYLWSLNSEMPTGTFIRRKKITILNQNSNLNT